MPYDRYGSDGLQVSRDPDSYPEAVREPKRAFHPASYNAQAQDYTAKETSTSVGHHPQPTICGISKRNFLITVLIALAIVVAGALGGGLGGGLSSKRSHGSASDKAASGSSSSSDSSSSSIAQISPSSTSSETVSSRSTSSSAAGSPSPTIVHSSDCPASNGTTYNSMSFASGNNGPVPDGAKNGLKFVKVCGTSLRGGSNVAQAVVATFNECIDLCASYNFWSGSKKCTSAAYNNVGSCWIGSGTWSQATASDGLDTAVLANV